MGKRPQPESKQAPVVQRIRVRYAKRGRLKFTSHRDFARALERAVRRANVPIGYSSGFSPHPKISYASAAPTGVASEAEYLEIGLQAPMDPADLRAALDAVLPDGLDILEAVEAHGSDFASRLTASHWHIELPGVEPESARAAAVAYLAADEILVERMTKSGRRTMDARSPVVDMSVTDGGAAAGGVGNTTPGPANVDRVKPCAILEVVVRHVTPSVRPDDVLAGLHAVAALEPPVPPKVTRLAQGDLHTGDLPADGLQTGGSHTGSPGDTGNPEADGLDVAPLIGRDEILDPLAADRDGAADEDRAVTGTPST